jgi:hypothetical protein
VETLLATFAAGFLDARLFRERNGKMNGRSKLLHIRACLPVSP